MSNELVESEDKQIWCRLENESWQAFEVFRIYRELNAVERKVSIISRKGHKSREVIKRWMEEYRWQERLDAYSDYLNKLESIEFEKQRKLMIQRHIDAAMRISEKAMEAAELIDINDLSAKDISTWLDLGIKHERLARGQETENVKTQPATLVQNITQNILSSPDTAKKATDLFDSLVQDKHFKLVMDEKK